MKTSANGVAKIRAREGCKLTAYQDSGGVWTIGVVSGTAARFLTWFDEEDGFQWKVCVGDWAGVLFLTAISAGLADRFEFTTGPTVALGGALGMAGIDFATKLVKTTLTGMAKMLTRSNGEAP